MLATALLFPLALTSHTAHHRLSAPRPFAVATATRHRALAASTPPPSNNKVLQFVLQAATAKGKADLETIRTMATLVGAGDELSKLEKSIGMSGETEVEMGRLLQAAGSVLDEALLPKAPKGRWRLRLSSLALAVLAAEVAQLCVVALLAWLLGAGASGGTTPTALVRLAAHAPVVADSAHRLLGAAGVALHSRGATRPLRFAAEVWLYSAARRRLLAAPAGRKRRRAVVTAAVALLALPLLGAAVTLGADAWLHSAAVVAGGAKAAASAGLPPPAALLVGAALAPIDGRGPFATPRAGQAMVAATIGRVAQSWAAVVAAVGRLAGLACAVKPLRAAWELLETDAWVADVLVAAARRVRPF